MTVNRSSVLSVEYFESYLNLVVTSRGFNLDEALNYVLQNFFKGDPMYYGKETYLNLILAFNKI